MARQDELEDMVQLTKDKEHQLKELQQQFKSVEESLYEARQLRSKTLADANQLISDQDCAKGQVNLAQENLLKTQREVHSLERKKEEQEKLL